MNHDSRVYILFLFAGWSIANAYNCPLILEGVAMCAALGIHWLLGQIDSQADPRTVPSDPYRHGRESDK